MSTFKERWKKIARSKKYREEFVAAQVKRGIPFQIRTLMKKMELSQEKLASRAGLAQGVVSRAANLNYGNLTLNTIIKIAAGFDVAFIGRFVPFTELDRWFANLSEESVLVRTFTEENKEIEKQEAIAAIQTDPTVAQGVTHSLADLMNPSPEILRSIELTLSSLSTVMREGSQRSTLGGFLQPLGRTADNAANSRSTLPARSQPTPAGVLPGAYGGLHLVSSKPPDRARMKAANAPLQAA